MRLRRRRLLLAAAAAAAGACGDSSGPGERQLAGLFTLTEVDGTSVPALPPSGTQLLAGFLDFRSGSEALRILTTRTTPMFGPTVVETDTTVFTVQRAGSRIVLRYPGSEALADTGSVTTEASGTRIDVRTLPVPGAPVAVVTYRQ